MNQRIVLMNANLHVSLWRFSLGKALKSLFMDPKHEAPSHSELLTAISSSQCKYSVVY